VRAERRIAIEQGTLLAGTLVAATLLSDREQWDRPWLLAALLGLAFLLERLTVNVGEVRVSMGFAGLNLVAVLLGPSPAALVAVLVIGADAAQHRSPRHVALTNLTAFALGALLCGVIVHGAVDLELAVPGKASYLLAVMAGQLAFTVVNLGDLVYARGIAGHPRSRQMQTSILPLVPWEVVSIAMIAATAHLYLSIGVGAVAGLTVVFVFFRALLDSVSTAERRQQEIAQIAADRDRYMREALAAEERERRRLAAELHDDALQTLLSARADLVEGLSGDEERLHSARDAVAAAAGKLRDLMVRLGPTPTPDPAVGPAVRELAGRIGRRSGFTVGLEIAPALEDRDDPLVVDIVRELLTNVAKHARATAVTVTLAEDGEELRVEVLDDGVGFDHVDRARVRDDGHVGLSLVDERAASRGGVMRIGSRPGGSGTRAEVVLAKATAPAAV
jgi:signal transduction histidine kinase